MKTKKHDFEILKDQNVMIRYFRGEISLQDLFAFAEIIALHPDYDPKMRVINNLIDAEFIFSQQDIVSFVEFVKNHKKIYGSRRIVFLTDTPNQVVFTTMVKMFKEETLIDIGIVSTLEASINFLGLEEDDLPTIEKCIERLKS